MTILESEVGMLNCMTGRHWIMSKLQCGALWQEIVISSAWLNLWWASSVLRVTSSCKHMHCFTAWWCTCLALPTKTKANISTGTPLVEVADVVTRSEHLSVKHRQYRCWPSSDWRSSRSVGKATKSCSYIWCTVVTNPPSKAPASPRCPEGYDQQEK